MKICLFLTHGMSLTRWDSLGMLNREMRLYECLAEHGIEVGMFTYGTKRDLRYKDRFPGIHIIPAWEEKKRIPTEKESFLLSWRLPLKFRREFAYFDLFKTNQMWGAWVPLMARILVGKPILLRCGYEAYSTALLDNNSTGLMRILLFWISRWAYSSANKIALSSKGAENLANKVFDLSSKNVVVQPNYVDTELFCPLPPDIYYPKRILCVGRLESEKNLFSLIKAVAKINAGLDIIGNGSLREPLRLFAAEYGADVRFLGIKPNKEIPGIMARYPVFVLPSIYEGHPKTLLEAMSCQMAVIGTNVQGIKEVIDDGVNGLLCGTSSESLAFCIKRLLNDNDLRNKLGKEAENYIQNNISLEKIVSREIQIYKEILRNKHTSG